LVWEIYIKKRERSTGVTNGIIAGVYAVMCGGKLEMWLFLRALSTTSYSFGEAGDSGAVAMTPDGMAVGK
jgi:hypothetical protein